MKIWRVLVAAVVCFPAVLVFDGPVPSISAARAQSGDRGDSDRDRDDDDRPRWFNRRRGGDRDGRDDRGRGDDDDRDNDRDRESDRGSSSSSSTSRPTSTTTSSTSGSTTTSGSSASMDLRGWATNLVKEKDTNKNGFLDGDEVKELRGKAATSDLNNDKVITAEELVTHLSGGTPATAPAATTGAGTPSKNKSADAGGSSGGSDRSNDSKDGGAKRVYTGTVGVGVSSKEGSSRRTYRFARPADRLPASLPSFFKSNDRNNDGQIAMSEFSRTWSSSKVAEFQRYDRNGDGIITAKEAAR